MNEKLKQSLEGRLGGMRWGERDQQEVFRLIQRKELQDVKHVKRGTGMLAIAIAMLFIVMGAAFALTTLPQPEDNVVAGQPTQTDFVPVQTAQYENEYFTVTIDATEYDGSELSFTATLRLKEPQSYMFLSLGGHTQPGDPNRAPLRIGLRATVQTTAEDLLLVSGGDLDSTPEVLAMTSDSATIRMAGTPESTGPEMQLALEFTFTDPATGRERTDVLRWTAAGTAQFHLPLLENKYITVTLLERRMEGTQGVVVLEITPTMPWYTLNRSEEDKAALQVHCGDVQIYDCSDHSELLDMIEHRQPPLAAYTGTMETTSTGLRCTIRGEMPEGSSLLGYMDVTISPEAEMLHESSDLPHYAEVIIPMPIAENPPSPAVSPTPQPAAKGMWIFENDLVVGYSVSTVVEGEYLRVTIDVVPKNAEHVINTAIPGKTSLYVSTAWYGGYDGKTPLKNLSVADGAFIHTEDGARLSALLPFPEEHQTLTFSLDVTTIGNGAQHLNHFISTLYRPGAYPTPAPVAALSPTPTPMPTARPEPTGKYIGGDEIVSLYMEECWSDGFTTIATLRIRADDPSNRLAALPNQNGMPDGSTWVVQLTGPDTHTSFVQMHVDETTGDLLAEVTFLDLSETYQDGVLNLTLTTTNELTWERHSATMYPVIPVNEDYSIKPLCLISSDKDGIFVQGSLLTSDRYQYIGVMLDYSVGYSVIANLALDGNPEVASSGAYAISGASLISFPRQLFPYEGSDSTRFILLVLRLDKDVVLPDPLPIRLTSGTPAKGYTSVAEMELSPNRALQQMDSNVIFETPLLTATLVQTDFSEGVAAGQMQIRLKDPISYTLDPNDPAEGKVYVELTTAVCAYNGDERPAEYVGDCAILTDVQPDSCMVTFYGYFPDWHSADSADPWCISLIDARAEDGRFREHYDARFRFPQTGNITRWTVKPVGSDQIEGFHFDSGLLVQTDYLNAITIRWTGEAKLGSVLYNGNEPAQFLPYMTFIRGNAMESEPHTENYFLEEYDENATYYVMIYPSGEQAREQRPLLFIIPDSD